MEPVDVVSLIRLDQGRLGRLEALGQRLRVADAAEMARAEARRGRAGEAMTPEERRPLDQVLAPAQVLYALWPLPDLLARAPRLRWVQLTSAGVEQWRDTGVLQSPAVLTNARGVASAAIAEHALMMMLMLVKGAPQMLREQGQRRWQRFRPGTLQGKTLGVVGLGSIGGQAARLALALGMRVLALRRSAREAHVIEEGIRVLPPSALEALLGESDFVLISLPVTPETAGFIGEAQLRAMRPTAHLINVARGQIVDEAALVRALKEGWIAGAGLDVFQQEPLPPESELWGLPNVIISPHVSGGVAASVEASFDLFCENLRRFLAGQALLNVVDKERGY